MADVEAVIPVPIEGQHALDLGDGRPLGRGHPSAPIEQAVIAIALQPPPPHRARAELQDVRGLDPGELRSTTPGA
jgi:hypothetical protein